MPQMKTLPVCFEIPALVEPQLESVQDFIAIKLVDCW